MMIAEVEAEEEAEITEPEPIIDPVPEDEPVDPGPEAPVEADQPIPLPPVSARAGEADIDEASPPSPEAYPISPGTRSVLQGLQCPGNLEAFARTGVCPQGSGRHTAMVAADESAAEFYTIDVSAIRALFGVSPHALAGQGTLDNGTQRRSLANSDSIRDALPASQPDPAFGD